jgi:hypothetical protein
MQEDKGQRIHHHLRLPGGRQIEVIYLDGSLKRRGEMPPCASDGPRRAGSDTPVGATPWPGDSSTTAPGEALHVCPRCSGELMNPLDWVEESPSRWRIVLRCPDCDLRREGVFGQALVEGLDEELDSATAALLDDLRQLTHSNMADETEIFSRALQLDLIGPSDF